jgi:hypothetical protein
MAELMFGELWARVAGERRISVVPLTFGRARIIICDAKQPILVDDMW